MNKEAFHQYLFEGDDLYKPADGFRSGIFVLTEHDNEIPANERGLLENILRSIDIDISTVEFLVENITEIDPEKFRSAQFFVFGIDSGILSWLPKDKYSPSKAGGNTVVVSDSLSTLDGNKDLKMKLWGALKSLN